MPGMIFSPKPLFMDWFIKFGLLRRKITILNRKYILKKVKSKQCANLSAGPDV